MVLLSAVFTCFKIELKKNYCLEDLKSPTEWWGFFLIYGCCCYNLS